MKHLDKVCRNCCWWLDPGGWEQLPAAHRHRTCNHPKVGGGSYSDEARMSLDALNSYESIGVGPDFGCIHWES